MKVVLVGAFGKLGSDVLRALLAAGHEVVAADAVMRVPEDVDASTFTTVQIDVTKPETLKHLCDGADVVITTVGLTGASTRFTNYDIDYQGNLNLIEEARAAGVAHFGYVSVINADRGDGIPMVHSKYLLENKLKESGLTYVIWRPTGYFYDIAHVFWPMIKSKSVQLLKTKKDPVANVVDTRDFARFIVETMCDDDRTYSVGGTETYTYRQIAEMFYNADGVTNGPVKTVPAFMMDVLVMLPKIKAQGKSDVLKFSKFTLLNDCYGETEIPGNSFKRYIAEKSYAPVIEAELAAKAAAEKGGDAR